jgi:glucose/arabinose dehydrogenase/mono/diheme cytochrome c family protein
MQARRTLLYAVGVLAYVFLFVSIEQSQSLPDRTTVSKNQACPNDEGGLKLPAGFCATVFVDNIGHARHMVVAPNGAVYVNTWSGRYYGNKPPHEGGFLVALQDKTGSGKADVIERFGETVQTGGAGGLGIALYKGFLYAEINDRIVRYRLSPESIVPQGTPETIVSGLPLGGDHPMHPFLISPDGSMYVDVATVSNSCQLKNRSGKSPGADPCTELVTRGGIWRYDANKTNQVFSPGDRFATGIRNAEGFAIDSSGRIFVTQHGRDQLHANWPDLYKPEEEATQPAEELLLLKSGGDYGWPECYYDAVAEKLVLAPEYGGDGGKKIGACATKLPPVAAFPAHWAPNAMVLYDKQEFPARYHNGVFIAFHGSWNRAPYEQGGYNVVFQGLSGERASGECEVFADGFAGAVKTPSGAAFRPSGLAVGPDGALYVSDDVHGRIYRIVYKGGSAAESSNITPCPSPSAPAGPIMSATVRAPEAAADMPLPEGATRQMVALGDRIFHGQAGATCATCHGANGKGSSLGPDLTTNKWLWSDGSLKGIAKSISQGVMQPKQYRSAMPPKGGADLTDQQVLAVAAYVWTLSHKAKPASPETPAAGPGKARAPR